MKLNTVFWIIATIVGISSAIDSALHLGLVRRVPALLAVSPRPFAFGSFYGYEYWTPEIKLTLKMVNGNKAEIPLDRRLVSAISGPHVRKLSYLMTLAAAPLQSHRATELRMRKTFCHERSFAYLPTEAAVSTIAEIELTIVSIAPTRWPIRWKDTFRCR